MKKNVQMETLSKKAKKKKDFIIFSILAVILILVFSSFVSAFMDTSKKESFEERKKLENKKEFEVIKKQDLKETWAISIENRIEKQEEESRKAREEIAKKTEEQLEATRNLLIDSMASIQNEIKNMNNNVADKMADMEASIDAKILEQQTQIEDIALKNSSVANPYQMGNSGDVILGPDLLPPEIQNELDQNKVLKNDIKDDQKDIDIALDDLAPKILTPDEKTIEKKDEDKKQIEKKVTKKIKAENVVPKRAKLMMVDINVDSSIEAINEEEELYAQMEELKQIRTNSLHIMTGLTQAYMITGAYAPAFESGTEDPLPVLFQAEGDILIANNDTESIDKCMLIGSAKGNMNSKTADIRLHSITCSLAEGTKMIEGQISGWVIGENGIPGVQGELMHKNGAWLSNTFVAGFLETFASAFSDTGSTDIEFVTGDDGTVSTSSAVGDNAKSAAAGGLSTVFGKLGEYYLEMAEQIFPVIEVKGGRTVNILLKGGEDLQIKDFNKVDLSEIEDRITTEQEFIQKVGAKRYKELKQKIDSGEASTSSTQIQQSTSNNSLDDIRNQSSSVVEESRKNLNKLMGRN